MRRLHFVPLLATGLLAVSAPAARAQSSIPAIPRLHAIVDARVEIGDGRVLERATVVIRDGIIVAVGQDAEVPKGARVFPGKGLVVYPGFIDAFTTKGMTAPTLEDKQDDPAPQAEYATALMREANRKQVHPEVEARRYLALTEDVRKPYITNGFTTLMVVPAGLGLRGQGTLVNLSGRAPRECIVISNTGHALSWGDDGSGSAYPGALLGSVAQFRQAFADALWQQQVAASGIGRPYSDLALEAINSARATNAKFFVEANSISQIERAMRMQKEWSFPMVLVGAHEAYRTPNRLSADTQIILNLTDLREPKAAETKTEDKKKVEAKPGDAKPADEKPADAKPADAKEEKKPEDPDAVGPDPEDPAINAERIRIYKEAMSNAAVLAKAGHPFALATLGEKDAGDLLKQLRVAVKQGLPKETALRALTLDAAKLFGVDRQLGTIEVGKIANVSVMTTSFLDDKAKVKVLYIDGYRLDPDARTAAPAPRRRRGIEE